MNIGTKTAAGTTPMNASAVPKSEYFSTIGADRFSADAGTVRNSSSNNTRPALFIVEQTGNETNRINTTTIRSNRSNGNVSNTGSRFAGQSNYASGHPPASVGRKHSSITPPLQMGIVASHLTNLDSHAYSIEEFAREVNVSNDQSIIRVRKQVDFSKYVQFNRTASNRKL